MRGRRRRRAPGQSLPARPGEPARDRAPGPPGALPTAPLPGRHAGPRRHPRRGGWRRHRCARGRRVPRARPQAARRLGEPRPPAAMTLRRFHVRPDAIEGTRLRFDAEEAQHMARALRLTPGDLVAAVDGSGRQYTVRLDHVTAGAAVGTVLSTAWSATESPLAI